MKLFYREILMGLAALAMSTSLNTSVSAQQNAPKLVDPPEPPGALKHLERAKQIAGTDLKNIAEGYICMPPAMADKWSGIYRANKTPVEPFREFDNLYYIGGIPVGLWLIKSNDGIIMLDALHDEAEAQNYVVPAMIKLGLDPASVKLIVISHSHGEHYGGAKYFYDHYKTKVVASAIDREEMMKNADKTPIPPIEVITDGQKFTVGDMSVQTFITPGHTLGTVSSLFSIKDKGITKYMTMLGGTRLLLNAYDVNHGHDSVHKLWDAGHEAGAIGAVASHLWGLDYVTLLKRPRTGTKSTLDVGREGYDRIMGIYDECTMAMTMRLVDQRKFSF